MKVSSVWCFILHVSQDTDLDDAWELLQNAGLSPLYVESDPERLAKIYIQAAPGLTAEHLLNQFPFIVHVHLEELGDIDWQAQWEAHGLNYHDGFVHVPVEEPVQNEWKEIKLKAGAGFGDLSHPSTRIVLKMMKGCVKNRDVIDIGCGSGVLGLYAVAQGAKHVYAIDIDESALKHAYENALINDMEPKINFYKNGDFNLKFDNPVILINMVMAEQEEAWKSLPSLHGKAATYFISGILEDQKEAYLKMVKAWGLEFEDELNEDGWLGLKLISK